MFQAEAGHQFRHRLSRLIGGDIKRDTDLGSRFREAGQIVHRDRSQAIDRDRNLP